MTDWATQHNRRYVDGFNMTVDVGQIVLWRPQQMRAATITPAYLDREGMPRIDLDGIGQVLLSDIAVNPEAP